MRKIIGICLFIHTGLFSGNIYASFFSGESSEIWGNAEEGGYVWFDSEAAFAEAESTDAIFKEDADGYTFPGETGNDEDPSLYAPPPGEGGFPQKVPLNGKDYMAWLAMACFLSGYYYMDNKRKNPVL